MVGRIGQFDVSPSVLGCASTLSPRLLSQICKIFLTVHAHMLSQQLSTTTHLPPLPLSLPCFQLNLGTLVVPTAANSSLMAQFFLCFRLDLQIWSHHCDSSHRKCWSEKKDGVQRGSLRRLPLLIGRDFFTPARAVESMGERTPNIGTGVGNLLVSRAGHLALRLNAQTWHREADVVLDIPAHLRQRRRRRDPSN